MSFGFPISLGSEVQNLLGNVPSQGYVSIINKENVLEAVIDVGTKDTFPNCTNIGNLEGHDDFLSGIEAFMADDYSAMVEAHTKALNYECDLDSICKNKPSFLQQSESNMEHCVLSDKDCLLPLLSDFKRMTLFMPTTGTISRLINKGYKSFIEEVILLRDADEEYLARINGMVKEFELKKKIVNHMTFSRKKLYYVSFGGALGKKLGIKHFFGYEPNAYQLIHNDLCTGMDYNEFGVTMKYYRKGEERTDLHNFNERINRYGSDILFERFRTSQYFYNGHPLIHDIVTSESLSFPTRIMKGRTVLSNAYGLIGNYHHKNNIIYDNDGNVVYVNDGRIHSCYDLDSKWVKLDGNGVNLSKSRYIIGSFSGVCIYLGNKYYYENIKVDYNNKVHISKDYYVVDTGAYLSVKGVSSTNCVVENNLGNISVQCGKNVICCAKVEVIPHNVNIWESFVDQEYCYGTYHTIVREAVYNTANDIDIFLDSLKVDVSG